MAIRWRVQVYSYSVLLENECSIQTAGVFIETKVPFKRITKFNVSALKITFKCFCNVIIKTFIKSRLNFIGFQKVLRIISITCVIVLTLFCISCIGYTKDIFDVLPEDWVVVTHNCGLPVYLHRKTRVCTWARPYFLGTGSARKHEVPQSAIPCLHYRRTKVTFVVLISGIRGTLYYI